MSWLTRRRTTTGRLRRPQLIAKAFGRHHRPRDESQTCNLVAKAAEGPPQASRTGTAMRAPLTDVPGGPSRPVDEAIRTGASAG